VKMTGGRVKLDEQYRMTTVDLNNLRVPWWTIRPSQRCVLGFLYEEHD
jgi:hypothetical protein